MLVLMVKGEKGSIEVLFSFNSEYRVSTRHIHTFGGQTTLSKNITIISRVLGKIRSKSSETTYIPYYTVGLFW